MSTRTGKKTMSKKDYEQRNNWESVETWLTKTKDAIGILEFVAMLNKRRAVEVSKTWAGVENATFLEVNVRQQQRLLIAWMRYQRDTKGRPQTEKDAWLRRKTGGDQGIPKKDGDYVQIWRRSNERVSSRV